MPSDIACAHTRFNLLGSLCIVLCRLHSPIWCRGEVFCYATTIRSDMRGSECGSGALCPSQFFNPQKMPKTESVKRVPERSTPYRRHYNHNVDKIEIVPETRWKTSEASGDEYRYGLRANLYHKAKVVKTFYMNQAWVPQLSIDGPKLTELLEEARFPPDAKEEARREPLCNHFGCSAPGDLYRLKQTTSDSKAVDDVIHTVRYCQEHCHRGDCAIVDNSDNLVRVAEG